MLKERFTVEYYYCDGIYCHSGGTTLYLSIHLIVSLSKIPILSWRKMIWSWRIRQPNLLVKGIASMRSVEKPCRPCHLLWSDQGDLWITCCIWTIRCNQEAASKRCERKYLFSYLAQAISHLIFCWLKERRLLIPSLKILLILNDRRENTERWPWVQFDQKRAD